MYSFVASYYAAIDLNISEDSNIYQNHQAHLVLRRSNLGGSTFWHTIDSPAMLRPDPGFVAICLDFQWK
jgi:hypothetical protein